MTDLPELLPTEDLEHVRPEPHPSWVQPTLATLTQDYFSDPEWLYERKLDGRLRHPRYQGLRRDKDARDVVREQT